MPMRHALRKALTLTPAEWADLLRAQLALVAAQLLVWLRPSGRLVDVEPFEGETRPSHAASSTTPAPRPAAQTERARRLALAVGRAAEHGVFRPQCLVRATALHRLLVRHGIAGSRILVGVRRDGASILAHAWVVLDGRVLDDREEHVSSFAPLTGVRIVSPR